MPSMRARILLVAVTLVFSAGACTLKQQADEKFGDQHFKTAIALVELYKVRHGSYPESLASLDYVGDWDKLALASVEYRQLSDGYELDVTRGWVGKPTLSYPAEFWRGPEAIKRKAVIDGPIVVAVQPCVAADSACASPLNARSLARRKCHARTGIP